MSATQVSVDMSETPGLICCTNQVGSILVSFRVLSEYYMSLAFLFANMKSSWFWNRYSRSVEYINVPPRARGIALAPLTDQHYVGNQFSVELYQVVVRDFAVVNVSL